MRVLTQALLWSVEPDLVEHAVQTTIGCEGKNKVVRLKIIRPQLDDYSEACTVPGGNADSTQNTIVDRHSLNCRSTRRACIVVNRPLEGKSYAIVVLHSSVRVQQNGSLAGNVACRVWSIRGREVAQFDTNQI